MDGPLSVVTTLHNYNELKRGQRLINEQLALLEKAESCGIDCQVFREGVQQVMGRITALEQQFFTPPPTR